MRSLVSRGGFTLIELLVVIAIIAVLLGLVMVGLDKAHEAALRTTSLANARQVGIAGATYQQDARGMLPFTPVYRRGMSASAGSGPLEGLCPWSFAGVNNDAAWAGRPFDIEAADRPMNPYIAPGVMFDAPPAPATMGASAEERACADIGVLRVRGFEDSLERTWPGTPVPSSNPGVTCYRDVGTSYLLNLRWLDAWSSISDPAKRLEAGLPRLCNASDSSKMVWFTDQAGEAVPRATNPSFEWENAFDDENRSVMGFLDGHVSYEAVRPGYFVDPSYRLTLQQRP